MENNPKKKSPPNPSHPPKNKPKNDKDIMGRLKLGDSGDNPFAELTKEERKDLLRDMFGMSDDEPDDKPPKKDKAPAQATRLVRRSACDVALKM